MNKNVKKALVITAVSVYAVFTVLSNATNFYSLFYLLAPQSPPMIPEGEFPFYVEYEMDGKRYVIEDTVVCSFDGYDNSAWFVRPRKWNESLKSGDNDKLTILREENSYSVLKPKRLNERSSLLLNYGIAEYYMDDKLNLIDLVNKKPGFYYSESYSTDERTTYVKVQKLSEKELEKYFGINVIRFEFSKPIKNKFR